MKIRALLFSVMIGLLPVAGSGTPAAAATVSLPNVTITWDESIFSPSADDQCGRYYFDYRINTTGIWSVGVYATNASGATKWGSDAAYYSPFPPGKTGSFFIDGCAYDGWMGPVTASFYQATESYVGGRTEQVATFNITQAPPQETIEVMNASCASAGVTAASKFCSSDTVLKLKDAANWAYGSRMVPYLHLYNRKGVVPLNVELFDHARRNDTPATMYARPQASKFTPGKYMIVAHNGFAEGATCRISSNTVTCSKQAESHSVKTYTFTWDGNRVTNVKFVPQSKVSKIRL